MDDAVSQPVAVYCGGSQGGCQAADDCFKALISLTSVKLAFSKSGTCVNPETLNPNP